ncbi:hypothetical protein AMECASPLE_011928 [Ameca splendens]|uniref:Uncharacterized protein n=1 Tax=Ameca splendens TaxID=208324 RepID=A0ABV0XPW2_9TELE
MARAENELGAQRRHYRRKKQPLGSVSCCMILMPLFHWLVLAGAAPLHSNLLYSESLFSKQTVDPVSTTPSGAVFPVLKEGQWDRITVATAVTCSLAGPAEQAAPPHSYRGSPLPSACIKTSTPHYTITLLLPSKPPVGPLPWIPLIRPGVHPLHQS